MTNDYIGLVISFIGVCATVAIAYLLCIPLHESQRNAASLGLIARWYQGDRSDPHYEIQSISHSNTACYNKGRTRERQ